MGRRQKPLDDTKEILLKTMLSVGSSADVISFPGVDVSDEQSLINMYTLDQKFLKDSRYYCEQCWCVRSC